MGRIRGSLATLGMATALCLGAVTTVGCATSGQQDLLDEDQRKARSHYGVAIEYLRDGRPALAIRELRAALLLDPKDPWIHLSLAEAYRQKGHNDEAEAHMLKSLELKPGFQPGRLNLSALYVQLERYDDAIVHAQKLIDDPTFPVPWKALTNLGWAQFKAGRLIEARQSLELALEYDGRHTAAVLGIAAVEMEAGKHLEALQYLDRVLELKPGPLVRAEANYRIGEIYVTLGNRSKAMQHLTAASQTEPSGEWGKRSKDYLRRLR